MEVRDLRRDLYHGDSECQGMGKPGERRETEEQDLFRARLDQILNMKHELVRLKQAIDSSTGRCWKSVSARSIPTGRGYRP